MQEAMQQTQEIKASKKRVLTPEQKEKRKAYIAAWRAANPDKCAKYKADQRTPEKKAAKAAHMRERYANDPEFRAERIAYNRERYASDPERFKKEDAARRDANADALREKRKSRYAADPERYKVAVRARRAANPELLRSQARARRNADLEKHKAQARARYAAAPDKRKSYERTRRAENLEAVRKAERARRRANREEHNARQRAARAADPEGARKKARVRYERSRDRVLAKRHAYEADKREKLRQQAAEWRKRNGHRIALFYSTRRDALTKATPRWSDDELNQFILEEAYHLRSLRTEMTGVMHHVDHVLPLQGRKVSGLHVGLNLQVLPAKANSAKCHRFDPSDPDKWRWPLGSAYR